MHYNGSLVHIQQQYNNLKQIARTSPTVQRKADLINKNISNILEPVEIIDGQKYRKVK